MTETYTPPDSSIHIDPENAPKEIHTPDADFIFDRRLNQLHDYAVDSGTKAVTFIYVPADTSRGETLGRFFFAGTKSNSGRPSHEGVYTLAKTVANNEDMPEPLWGGVLEVSHHKFEPIYGSDFYDSAETRDLYGAEGNRENQNLEQAFINTLQHEYFGALD